MRRRIEDLKSVAARAPGLEDQADVAILAFEAAHDVVRVQLAGDVDGAETA